MKMKKQITDLDTNRPEMPEVNALYAFNCWVDDVAKVVKENIPDTPAKFSIDVNKHGAEWTLDFQGSLPHSCVPDDLTISLRVFDTAPLDTPIPRLIELAADLSCRLDAAQDKVLSEYRKDHLRKEFPVIADQIK